MNSIKQKLSARFPELWPKLTHFRWKTEFIFKRTLKRLRRSLNPHADKKEFEARFWEGLIEERAGSSESIEVKKEALFKECWEDSFPRYLEALRIKADHFSGKRILDVGCGPITGVVGFEGAELHGVDHLIDEYIRMGYPLDRHDVKYANAPSEKTLYPDDYFDSVISINALDHVDHFDRTVKEMARVLKPGGELMAQINLHEKPTATEPLCLRPHQILKIAEESGLWMKEVHYSGYVKSKEEDRYLFNFFKVKSGEEVSD